MAFQIILLRLQLVVVGLLFFSVLKVEGEDRAGPEWWSLQPLKEVKPPSNGQRHVIDSFVVSHLKERGLELSPMASPRSQIRRLYFDLVGMPPTVEEVRAFEADPSNRAYLGVVNDLLASPAYGER